MRTHQVYLVSQDSRTSSYMTQETLFDHQVVGAYLLLLVNTS
jgi:hypothetical protein